MKNANRSVCFLLLTIAFVLSYACTSAQTFSYKISDEDIKGNDIALVTVPVSGGSITLFNSKHGHAMLIDKNIQVITEADLADAEKDVDVFNLVKTNGKLFFVYTTEKKSTFSLHAKEIDEKTLSIKAEKKGITEFADHRGHFETLYYHTLRSADSSKLVFYSDHREYESDHQRVQFAVMDKDLNKLYEKDYSFPIKGRSMWIADYFLGMDGSMYFLYFYYPNGENMDGAHNTKDRSLKNFELRLLKIGEKEEKEITIPGNGLFFETISAFEQPNGMMNVTGLYRQDYDDRVIGSFRSAFSFNDKAIHVNAYPFSPQVIDQLAKGRFFRETSSVMELKYRNTRVIADNNAVFMFDQYRYYPNFGVGKEILPVLDDVILNSFSQDGKSTCTVLPDFKKSAFPLHASSGIFMNRGKLLVFYSNDKGGDEAGEKKPAGFYVMTLDLQGNILSKKMIIDYSDLGKYRLTNIGMARDGNVFFAECYKSGVRTMRKLCRITMTE